MKKKIFIGIGAVILVAAGYAFYVVQSTSGLSPKQTSEYTYQGLNLSVVYGSPSKRGRLIFGEKSDEALVPNGEYWRLGANDATEVTFSKNVVFGGEPVPAGTYRMYCLPSARSWDITLNSELGKFGFFEPDHELDVATVTAPVQQAENEMEMFTIEFASDSVNARMSFVWDKTLVSVPITIQ